MEGEKMLQIIIMLQYLVMVNCKIILIKQKLTKISNSTSVIWTVVAAPKKFKRNVLDFLSKTFLLNFFFTGSWTFRIRRRGKIFEINRIKQIKPDLLICCERLRLFGAENLLILEAKTVLNEWTKLYVVLQIAEDLGQKFTGSSLVAFIAGSPLPILLRFVFKISIHMCDALVACTFASVWDL